MLFQEAAWGGVRLSLCVLLRDYSTCLTLQTKGLGTYCCAQSDTSKDRLPNSAPSLLLDAWCLPSSSSLESHLGFASLDWPFICAGPGNWMGMHSFLISKSDWYWWLTLIAHVLGSSCWVPCMDHFIQCGHKAAMGVLLLPQSSGLKKTG